MVKKHLKRSHFARCRRTQTILSAMQAFLLLIQHEYKSIRDRDAFIELFKPLAKYVKQHEPETLAYELSVSDKDPHKLLVFERCSVVPLRHALLIFILLSARLYLASLRQHVCRGILVTSKVHLLAGMPYKSTYAVCPYRYSSKEALTEIHQNSAPFKKFKEQWTAAKLEYTSKTGESYLEEDLGFM